MRVQRSENGFILIVTCIALIFLLGIAVLAIDVARMRIIKSELQAFTDAAALNAALHWDGSKQDLPRARAAATELASGPNAMRWDMGTQPITAIQVSLSNDNRSVRVQASAPAPVIFLRVFDPSRDSTLITVASIAMKTPETARLVQ